MKGIKKIFVIVLIAILLYPSIATIFNIHESIAANKTGNTAIIKLAGAKNKIGSYWTYSKNGYRNLDLFCAQKVTHLDSWGNYRYEEAYWEANAGIFKNEDSFKKITWIKDNLWEMNNAIEKFTNAEKTTILKSVNENITEDMVASVFNSRSEKFKLYQSISWTYTNGNYYTVSLSGNTKTIYNAIIALAEKNYNITNPNTLKVEKVSDAQYDNATGNYTWQINVTNTYLLPYRQQLFVDGQEFNTTQYTFENGVITIPGLDVLIITFVLLLFLSITIEATEHPFNSLSKYFLIFKSAFKYLAKSLVGAYHLLSQSLLTPTLSPIGFTF